MRKTTGKKLQKNCKIAKNFQKKGKNSSFYNFFSTARAALLVIKVNPKEWNFGGKMFVKRSLDEQLYYEGSEAREKRRDFGKRITWKEEILARRDLGKKR